MSRKCQITNKTGLSGNRVSHANNKSRHVQKVNIVKKRIYLPELKRYVKVKMSAKGLKILDRKGAYRVLKAQGLI
ncbi:MAG: 50S ribosomal protein L28 [SAR324 cluster bacterium]|nr:50S ribosomal protein L28 [SAR324 cluster bacterium]